MDLKRIEIVDIPLSSPLKAGKEYIFHFKGDPKEKWAIINNSYFYDDWEEKPAKNGEYIYKFKIREPGILALGVKVKGSLYQHAISWTVIAE